MVEAARRGALACAGEGCRMLDIGGRVRSRAAHSRIVYENLQNLVASERYTQRSLVGGRDGRGCVPPEGRVGLGACRAKEPTVARDRCGPPDPSAWVMRTGHV